MEIKANELRIGNLLNYHTAEGDILTTTLDWQDLKWISDDCTGFNFVHSTIPLSEEILLKCGMHKSIWSVTRFVFNDKQDQFHIDILNDRFVFRGLGMSIVYVDFLHDLQNLYFAVTRKELPISI